MIAFLVSLLMGMMHMLRLHPLHVSLESGASVIWHACQLFVGQPAFHPEGLINSKAVIGCVLPHLGGAIWWMLIGWRLAVPDWIVSNL